MEAQICGRRSRSGEENATPPWLQTQQLHAKGGAVCVLPSQDTGRVISTPDHRSISSGETQRQDMAICMLVQLSEYQINKLK
nr:hypothetical protein Itr_chr08CG22070 [Ipomoea trifida]